VPARLITAFFFLREERKTPGKKKEGGGFAAFFQTGRLSDTSRSVVQVHPPLPKNDAEVSEPG